LHQVGENLTTDFHTYEMIWKADSIEIIFDEELIHTYTANSNDNISNLLGEKQKIVLNTAVVGLFFTDRDSDNYVNNAIMEIEMLEYISANLLLL